MTFTIESCNFICTPTLCFEVSVIIADDVDLTRRKIMVRVLHWPSLKLAATLTHFDELYQRTLFDICLFSSFYDAKNQRLCVGLNPNAALRRYQSPMVVIWNHAAVDDVQTWKVLGRFEPDLHYSDNIRRVFSGKESVILLSRNAIHRIDTLTNTCVKVTPPHCHVLPKILMDRTLRIWISRDDNLSHMMTSEIVELHDFWSTIRDEGFNLVESYSQRDLVFESVIDAKRNVLQPLCVLQLPVPKYFLLVFQSHREICRSWQLRERLHDRPTTSSDPCAKAYRAPLWHDELLDLVLEYSGVPRRKRKLR